MEICLMFERIEDYTIWLFNIAMENPRTKWCFFEWEHHLFLWAIYTMAMLVITRGYNTIESHQITIFLWFSYGFPMVLSMFDIGLMAVDGPDGLRLMGLQRGIRASVEGAVSNIEHYDMLI